MKALTVAVEVDTSDLKSTAEVIASLPISLVQVQSGGADIVVISGKAGWARQAISKIHGGTRGILVVDPTAEPVLELSAAAGTHGVPVVLDHPWASNAAVSLAQSELNATHTDIAFADFTASVTTPVTLKSALDELQLIATRLLGPIDQLTYLAERNHSLLATAHRRGTTTPVTLNAMLTPTRPFAVNARIVTATGGLEVRIPNPDTAAPAKMWSTNKLGSTLSPTLFESSHRSSWRRLIDHIRAATQPTDLDEWTVISR